MPNSVWNKLARSSLVTKVWVLDDGSVLSIRHWSGGTQLEGFFNGRLKFATTKCVKSFKKVLAKRKGFKYKLIVTHKSGQEFGYELLRFKMGEAEDTGPVGVEDDSIHAERWSPENEKHQHLHSLVSVPEVRIGGEEDGELNGVGLYLVQLDASDTNKASESWRRFNDFDILYTYVLSYYQGSHIKSSVASLPPKSWRKHATDPAEIETRRQGLEVWMQKTVALPRMAHNPDLLLFLGIFNAEKAAQPEPEAALSAAREGDATPSTTTTPASPSPASPSAEQLAAAQLHTAHAQGLITHAELRTAEAALSPRTEASTTKAAVAAGTVEEEDDDFL